MTMTKTEYLSAIEHQLLMHYRAIKEDYPPSDMKRHRLEGFIQGAVFMQFASREDIAALLEQTHIAVFGMSAEARRAERSPIWVDGSIDYSEYDQPTYDRIKK